VLIPEIGSASVDQLVSTARDTAGTPDGVGPLVVVGTGGDSCRPRIGPARADRPPKQAKASTLERMLMCIPDGINEGGWDRNEGVY
jgi:hypothetical protein